MTPPQITLAGAADLGELLVLMRGYCDFYEVAPTDEDLLALAQTLLERPETSGIQLLAAPPTAPRSASRRSTGATRPSRRGRSA